MKTYRLVRLPTETFQTLEGEYVGVQDSEAYNQRNIAEEGGGGYVAFVWDCAYWGTQVKLAQFTGDTKYSSEVCPHCLHDMTCHMPTCCVI